MNFLIPILLTITQFLQTQAMFQFRDETPANFDPPNLKYGGPAIADLDGNGYPDLILGYHGGAPLRVYFNFDGQFIRSPFKSGGDMHGSVPFRPVPTNKAMHFTISRGGRRGKAPRSPTMFSVIPATAEIRNITDDSGITKRIGRGRTGLYLDMSLDPNRSVPDAVYINSDFEMCPSCDRPRHHTFANIGNVQFVPRNVKGLTASPNKEGTVVDIDNDGIMEIIMFSPSLQIFKLIAPYKVQDITAEVLPKSAVNLARVQAVSELDFDNDGDFDLYIAVGKTGVRALTSRGEIGDDVLLENRNGVFVDVSKRAGIPKGTFSFGVTAADFNNDGFMDIFVTMYHTPDILLQNNGDGTFETVENLIDRPANSRGDMAQAVDYDRDGRVDLIVSQGERGDEAFLGRYRVFRNTLKGPQRRNSFVLVRVGSSPKRRAVSLHAVVTVTSGNKTWVRRVGSPGTAISSSYIELIHVGIGDVDSVDVSVRWVNGEVMGVDNVAKGSKINVGTFGRRDSVGKRVSTLV